MPLSTHAHRATHRGSVERIDLAPTALVEAVIAEYPAAGRDPGVLAFIVHALLTEETEPPGRTLPAFYALLGALAGAAPHQVAQRNFRADEYLHRVHSALVDGRSGRTTIKVIDHDPHRQQGRRVRLHGVPAHLLAIAEAPAPLDPSAWRSVRPEGQGHFKLNRTEASRRRSALLASLPESELAPPASVRLQEYLHSRSPQAFAALRRAVGDPDTDAFLQQHYPGGSPPEQRRRMHVVRALMGIYASPMPVYALSPWSPRIHARGLNITGVPSLVRQHLTARLGWAELDLVHAQLACNARWWGVEPVLERLRDPDYHFWDDLVRHVGGDPVALRAEGEFERLKAVLKRPVQGISFAMGASRVRRMGAAKSESQESAESELVVREMLNRSAAEVGDALLTHPVLKEMRKGSYRQLWRIKQHGGLQDVFGRWIPCKSLKRTQILAFGTQARELWLLMPAVELAIAEAQKPEAPFQIVVWQHDGFTVKARERSRLCTHVERLQRAVSDRAERAGIPTRLDLKVGPECG